MQSCERMNDEGERVTHVGTTPTKALYLGLLIEFYDIRIKLCRPNPYWVLLQNCKQIPSQISFNFSLHYIWAIEIVLSFKSKSLNNLERWLGGVWILRCLLGVMYLVHYKFFPVGSYPCEDVLFTHFYKEEFFVYISYDFVCV